jgi:hypothetical protein
MQYYYSNMFLARPLWLRLVYAEAILTDDLSGGPSSYSGEVVKRECRDVTCALVPSHAYRLVQWR